MNLFKHTVMFFLPQPKKYTYAMMNAIDLARKPTKFELQFSGSMQSRTNGLRVIRRFEKVNKIPFNPLNDRHLKLVEGNAGHEAFFRSFRLKMTYIQRKEGNRGQANITGESDDK